MLTLAGGLCLGAIFVFLVLLRTSNKRRILPPGPPADPIIGHLRLLSSRQDLWVLFHELSQRYGDVMYLDAMGKPMVVLSTEEAARDLLEKRGTIYSDRPPFTFYFELGWRDLLIFLPYGERFISQRRIVQQPFTNQRVAEYRDIQRRAINTLLANLLDSPTEFAHHMHMLNSEIMVDVVYGHQIQSKDDRYLKMVDVFSHYGNMAIYLSVVLLNYIPILKHLPAWVPGTWFISTIQSGRAVIKHAMEFPVAEVRQKLADGRAPPSVTASHLEALLTEGKLTREKIYELELAGQMMISGGVETTRSTLIVFIAAMALHPEAQKRAQQEIDRVIGNARLPDYADRDALPYVDAIMQEVMRWRPVGPTGVPHVSAVDDEYNGMFIPKGATIFPNLWSMCLNENVYRDAQAFKPERYLPQPEGLGEPPSSNFIFGFGRRKCPGQHLAENTMWLTMARMLAVLGISKAKDAHNKDIEIDLQFVSTGLTIYPQDFACEIRPRTAGTEALAREAQNLRE